LRTIGVTVKQHLTQGTQSPEVIITSPNMRSYIANPDNKAWYRLLKVLYVLAYLIAFGVCLEDLSFTLRNMVFNAGEWLGRVIPSSLGL